MRTLIFGLTLLVVLVTTNAHSSNNVRAAKILDQLFNPDVYDSRIRPNGNKTDEPVLVTVNTYVRQMKVLENQEIDVQLTFRMEWRDQRLAYRDFGKPYITLTTDDQMWTPDLFFSNELESRFHNMMVPNVLVRIYPDGKLLYSRRISMRISCPMDLTKYPMDEQTCPIIIASYGYTTDEVTLVWKENDPVQVRKNLNLQFFSLEEYNTDDCTSRTTTGEYPCIKVTFNLQRELSSFFSSYYVPSMYLVTLAFTACWLSRRRVTARIMLGLFALLAMLPLAKTASPTVPYTTSMDSWFTYNILFIMIAFIETIMVQMGADSDDQIVENIKPGALGTLTSRISSKAHSLDVVSRILFPVLYALYNIVYWFF